MFKAKEYLINVKKILEKLEDDISNNELYNIFFKYLGSYLKDKKYYVDFASDNEVIIKKKRSKDMFHLVITPSLYRINSMGIEIVDKNGLYLENISVQFRDEGKQIVVTKTEIEKKVQGNKSEVASISNKTNIKNYIDKKLRYEYNYSTETCFRLSQNYSCATLSETFVDLNKNAVRRLARISEDEYYDSPAEIIYYEASDFVLPPFNDRYSSSYSFNDMNISTEQKFNDFVYGNNNIISLRRQK